MATRKPRQYYGKRNHETINLGFLQLLKGGSENRKRQFAEDIDEGLTNFKITSLPSVTTDIAHPTPKRVRYSTGQSEQGYMSFPPPSDSRTESDKSSAASIHRLSESKMNRELKRKRRYRSALRRSPNGIGLGHFSKVNENNSHLVSQQTFFTPMRIDGTSNASINMLLKQCQPDETSVKKDLDCLTNSFQSSIQVSENAKDSSQLIVSSSSRATPSETQLNRLPTAIIHYILLSLIPCTDLNVWPFYRKGARVPNIYATSQSDKDTIKAEKFIPQHILSLLLVSKEFYQLGTTIIYGTNRFHFSDPDSLKWWIKRIGTATHKLVGNNFCKVRSLYLSFGTGWDNPDRDLYPVVFDDQSFEERWYGVLASLLFPNARALEDLHIELYGWIHQDDHRNWPCRNHKPHQTYREACEKWRHMILIFLADHVRGLRHVQIENQKCKYLQWSDAQALCELMKMPIETAAPLPTRPKRLTLSMALRNIGL